MWIKTAKSIPFSWSRSEQEHHIEIYYNQNAYSHCVSHIIML